MNFPRSLLWKLSLAFVLVALTTAALVALGIRLTSMDRLTRLIIDQQRSNLEANLQAYYQAQGSWQGITTNWNQLRPSPNPARFTGGPPAGLLHDRRRLLGLADPDGTVLVPVDPGYPAGSTLPREVIQNSTPVLVNGKDVGYILVANLPPNLNPEETLFLQRTNESLVIAVIGAMAVAGVIGFLLARTLVKPLQALTHAAQGITAGELEQQVSVGSNDEIGQLAVAFNRMSQEVTRVNRLRRQMTADIAHDLRTPLTVIAGYVESMRDGVLQPTPERLALIYQEIERLQNLVGDLKMLSLADAGELPLRPQRFNPKQLLEQVAAPFQTRAEQQGVSLNVQAAAGLPDVNVDGARMMQVFGNLISNALRYTHAGGSINLSAQASDGQVQLILQDDGEGIEADEVPYIFDRFHRADKSRHTANGESGLGLAIVKALIEAHGGAVTAESKLGEGTRILVSLPAHPAAQAQQAVLA